MTSQRACSSRKAIFLSKSPQAKKGSWTRCCPLYLAKVVFFFFLFSPPFSENCFIVSTMPIFGMRISKQTDGTPGVLQSPLDFADGKLFQSFYKLCCGNTIILQLQSSKSIDIQLTYEPCVEITEFQNSLSHVVNYWPLISKWQKVCFALRSPNSTPLQGCRFCIYFPKLHRWRDRASCLRYANAGCNLAIMNAQLGRGSDSMPSARKSCFQTSKERSRQ